MKLISKALVAAAGIAAIAFSPAYATEGGDTATPPGAFIGSSAGVPPPGIYMFNQVFTIQANLVGPGTTTVLGNGPGQHTGVQAAVDAQGFLFVPGWTFLGATYDAVIVIPFVMQSLGSPINAQAAGMFNTYIVPVELSWRLGTSGFAVKTGLGIYLADGSSTGINGLGNVANPYYTFQPELILSYLKDGWNLSVAMYDEINTANSVTHYTTGDIFHADFTATKTIGKWTFGPVAYYIGQVTNDSCGVGCIGNTAFHVQNYSKWAVGGLLGYDFGPASLSVWATEEVYAKGSNAAVAANVDPSLIAQGATVFATLSYRLWAPEEPAKPAMFHK
ncbi:SphA family protein [Bradyrhizobium sp.]|uniref:SphA family protein n=1 Tax=Bradyrhizobium sp. TaxID=376 RepID=UPI003C790703